MSSSTHTQKAKKRAAVSKSKLESLYPHAATKLDDLKLYMKDLRRHSAKIVSGALLAGSLVLGTPTLERTFSGIHPIHEKIPDASTDATLQEQLHLAIPKNTHALTNAQERDVSTIVQEVLGVTATAELDGHRLNASYGRIGGEQHLPRYLGDSISQHDALQVKGLTAGRGAFGYFAPTKDALTAEDVQREKYYVAVQTMYLPNWNQSYKDLKEWYKFRKVLVINPSNGRSVVAVVGDAGPAAWTGKQFGGSPEVMEYLQPFANKNNGMVLLYFVDEHGGTIALGPVNANASQFIASK